MTKTGKKHDKYRIEQYFAIRQISGLSLSPDGKTIAYITNTNGLPNVWTIPLEGGWTSQTTLAEHAVKALQYATKKDQIIYVSDINGDENLQIFLISDMGGEKIHLSAGHEGAQAFFADWDKKNHKILFSSNKRDNRFFDTFIKDIISGKEECVYKSDSVNVEIAAGWNRDESVILYLRFYNNSNQDILLFDRKTSRMINITEHTGLVKNSDPRFNKKSDTVYFLSDNEREYQGLAYYKIKSGETGWFITEDWDITGYHFSKTEKFVVYVVNENGNSVMKFMNIKSGKTKKLKIPKGNILFFNITPDEKKIVVVHDGPRNPNDIYVYDIKKKKARQITYSMIGGIPKKHFTEPQEIKFKSFDGLEINGYLYIPEWLKKDGSNPAVVWPHGGPEWQEKNVFNKYFQILTNSGYIVIAPNFRGSTGYGKTFQRMIYGDWGGAEFKDVLASYDYLVNTGYADRKRIAVAGGSFGGFMTLTCITKAPDLWRCAVDVFGPSNLMTFIETIPEYWKPATYELIGHPGDNKELLVDRSPINHLENIKCPVFIVQGVNDPRVVKDESDQTVEKLRSLNKEVEYLLLEDEGHGFSKVSNNIMVWEKIRSFLDKHMKN